MVIPTREQLVTDEQVLQAFDYSLPGLAAAGAAFAQGDLAGAKALLCEYFRTRTNVHFLFDYRGRPLRPINPEENPYAFQAALGFGTQLKAFCLKAGEKMLQNIYTLPGEGRGEIDLGKNFERMIHFNFLTDQGTGHRHHLDMFVRGQFFEYLAILYHETGEQKVCEQFRTILAKFLQTYPLQVVDTSPGANRFQYEEDRDAMSVGFLALSYLTLLYTQLPYDAGEDTVFTLIKHLWFLGLQFRRFDTDSYKPYNHHMWERGLVPFMLGTLLPEIPDFTPMRDHGAAIVCRHVKDDFNEQGGYNEHSIAYWGGAALGEMLYRGVSIARSNDVTLLDEDAMQRLDKSFTVLAAIAPCALRYPTLGDNRGPLVNSILQLGAAMTDNAACRALLSVRTGQKNPDANVLLHDSCNEKAGFVCLRDENYGEKSYLLMSAKTDCGASGHNHMDMLSLFVSIRGKSIIGEPNADFFYRNVKMGSAQRGYLYNMGAHNTVLAFGSPIVPDRMFADKWGVYRPDSPVTAFESTPQGAYVCAHHVGYPQCRHTRKLLFARSGALFIRDEMARGNRVSEPHIQRWHLEPGCVVTPLDAFSVKIHKEGVALLCVWDEGCQISVKTDRELLHPAELPEGAFAAPVVDVSFSNMHDQTTDLLMVSLNFLLLDITEREPPDIVALRAQLAKIASLMHTQGAPELLARL